MIPKNPIKVIGLSSEHSFNPCSMRGAADPCDLNYFCCKINHKEHMETSQPFGRPYFYREKSNAAIDFLCISKNLAQVVRLL